MAEKLKFRDTVREVRSVSIDAKVWAKVDALANRFDLPRSRTVEILLTESLSEQAIADFLVGGPKNFDKLIRVLRWALKVDDEKPSKDVEVVRAALIRQ